MTDIGTVQVVRARVGERTVALPTARVRRIVRGMRIHPLLGADPAVLGLARYGGDPLVVVDLGTILTRLPPASRDRRTVIVARVGPEGATETIGIAVDDVRGVSAQPEAEDTTVDLEMFLAGREEGKTC